MLMKMKETNASIMFDEKKKNREQQFDMNFYQIFLHHHRYHRVLLEMFVNVLDVMIEMFSLDTMELNEISLIMMMIDLMKIFNKNKNYFSITIYIN